MKSIEEKVEKIISKLELTSAPVPVDEIASKFNVKIQQTSSKDFSGLLFRKDDIAFMAINSGESPVRQRFTIAHELGHFLLHPKENTFIEYRDNKYEENVARTSKEIEANQFAAALLMPKKFLEKDIKNLSNNSISGNDISKLAERYKVSEKAMTYRLINLNFFSK